MYKTRRKNHDFQIAYFLAGSCHTADGAYALLCDLLDDRELAVKAADAGKLKNQAKRLRWERQLKSADEAERLEAQGELAEMEAHEALSQGNYSAALDEITFIKKCMEKLEPHRRYKHLPLSRAHEAAQSEEWKLELIHRAENFLLTSGTIPSDHLSTMRQHPEFKTVISPAIARIQQTIAEGGNVLERLPERKFDLQDVLQIDLKPEGLENTS